MKSMTEYRKIFNEKLDKTDNFDEAFTKAVWRAYLDGAELTNAKIELMQARIDELVEALELLRDNQNGCPLPKYEENWNEAIRLTDEAIAKVKDVK